MKNAISFIVGLLLFSGNILPLNAQNYQDLLASGKYLLNASSGSNDTYYLVDNNENSIWSSQKFQGTDGNAWIEFSFPESQLLELLQISWSVPATSFTIEYENENSQMVPFKYGRNKSKYGDTFFNELELAVTTKKLKILMNQRVFASILTGGDLDDIDELGYEIREIKLYGVPQGQPAVSGN